MLGTGDNTTEMDATGGSKPTPQRDLEYEQRQTFVKHMRFMFCRRPDFPDTEHMLNGDGTFNEKYFETQVMEVEERKWTERERALLLQGINTLGIGSFGEISATLLPDWTANELRIKSMHLLGRQNLSGYKGWRGDEQAIAREFERNKKIGLATGCWKGGVLVSDDHGEVQRLIDETEGQ
eukprot:comp4960_c0_seq2/m.1055 comp4960_c0_seq2/g.1055  ORF comp4960_c0_seq2/g.1055 comp4960_c0_seq2/m.1055 type:complete len:180 (-) comp4960_c0_seq2:645-1184(-)